MLALCLMLLGTYYTLPIMLALCLMLLGTYYAQNYAGVHGRFLQRQAVTNTYFAEYGLIMMSFPEWFLT